MLVVGLGTLRHWSHGPMVAGLETGQIKMGDVITDPPRLIVVPDSTNNNTGELGLLRGGQTTHTKLLWRSPLPNSGLGTVHNIIQAPAAAAGA